MAPHPATMARPRAAHPAKSGRAWNLAGTVTDRRGGAAAQPMIVKTNVAGWTFKHFRNHVAGHPKRTGESWDDYRIRLLADFDNFNALKQSGWLQSAIDKHKKQLAPKVEVKAASKPKLWSNAYVYNGTRWSKASLSTNKRDARTTTNSHAEQELFSLMGLPRDGSAVWIGFDQNEFPCIGEGCCDFFRGVSKRAEVKGVIFRVSDAGGYALEHGREIGSSANIYFVNGRMSYKTDDIDGVEPNDVPPPPP